MSKPWFRDWSLLLKRAKLHSQSYFGYSTRCYYVMRGQEIQMLITSIVPQTCKALVLMAKQLGYTITDQLIDWCASPALGGQTARGFELIVGDDNLVLNKSSGAVINVSNFLNSID